MGIFQNLDEQIREANVAKMSNKKAQKWLRKKFTKGRMCSDRYYPKKGMGILMGYESGKHEVLHDAVKNARSRGFGHGDDTELARVYQGTHESLRADQIIGKV